MSEISIDTTDDTVFERRDIASRGLGFLSWLADLAAGDSDKLGDFADLYFIIRDSKFVPMYDFARYSETIRAIFPDDKTHAERLITLMLRAESEWRIDRSAKEDARTSLGLDKKTGKDLFAAAAKPMRCGFKNRAGKECPNHVVPGSPRCEEHGGAILDPETRQSMLMVAYARLVEGSDDAVAALIEIARSSRSDIARVQAAKEILDRSGLSPELRVTVTDSDSVDDRLYRLKKHLESSRTRIIDAARLSRELSAGTDDSITDAVVVEDDEEKVLMPEVLS